MKPKALWVALVVSAMAVFFASAESGPRGIPELVASGLRTYKADGAEAAVNTWLMESPIQTSAEAQEALHKLREFESLYGQYRSFHGVRTVVISPTCQMSYIQLDYEKGPAFGKMLVYSGAVRTLIVSISFSADPEHIWGVSLFGTPAEP